MVPSPNQVAAAAAPARAVADRRVSRADALALTLLMAVLGILAWRLWGYWGSLRTDCGHEVYVPVSILRGRLLYRDIWYPWGPLAPYLQAALLWVFGVHLEVFYALGLAITAACTGLLFSISRQFLPTLPAFSVGLAFVLQALQPAFFNYIFPYGYAAALGVLLALACLHSLLMWIRSNSPRDLGRAALAAALALLCKLEFGVACVATLGFVLLLQNWLGGSRRSLVADLLRCLPAGLLVVLGYGIFASRSSFSFIFLENFNSFPGSIFMRSYGAVWIRRNGLRFDPPELLASLGSIVLVLAAWHLLGRLAGWIAPPGAQARGILLGAGLLAVVFVDGERFRWPALLLAFPDSMFWLAPVLFLIETARYVRKRGSGSAALAAVALLATLLGIRVMVLVLPKGYPIFYNHLLFMVFVIWVGRVIGAEARKGLALFHAGLLGVLLTPVPPLHHVRLSSEIGTIYGDRPDVVSMSRIASFMRRQSRQGKTTVVLPEETLLYVLAGTEAPTRWYQTTPGILGPEQEEEYLRLMEKAQVDYIIITNHDTRPYGVRFFGLDYHQRIHQWILANYEPVGTFGRAKPGMGSPLAATVYRRRSG